MLISEVKEHLDAELLGDNADYKISEAFLYDALLSVLRLTKPRTHIVKEKSDVYLFKYFRRINKDYWLRYPHVDLSDDAKLDMEEELAMAVVYFLCAKYSRDRKESFKKDAVEIVTIYDTNVNFRANPRCFNCYLLALPNTQNNPNEPLPTPLPILKFISLAVGDKANILVENSSGGVIRATSSSSAVKVLEIKDNIVTIQAVDENDKTFITIKGGENDFRVEVFSAHSDGGIID